MLCQNWPLCIQVLMRFFFSADSLTCSSWFDVFPSLFVAALCAYPQMSRSTSTFSLSDSGKSSAMVQRSNSLDHPPVRLRVPIGIRVPCSPTQIFPHSPTPKTGCEINQSLHPNSCLQNEDSNSVHNAPNFPLLPKPQSSQHSSQQTIIMSVGLPPVQNSKLCQPKASQQLSSVGCQSRLLVYRNLQVEPHRAVKSSPQRETLL